MNRVLLFEPNSTLATKLKHALERKNLWVHWVSTRAEAHDALVRQPFQVCLWSVSAVGEVPMLAEVRTRRMGMALIATSEVADPRLVVDCMRMGASNFYLTSDTLETFECIVTETLARVVPDRMEEQLDFPFHEFVGRHPQILEIFQLILSIKESDSTVLITGESGTGKELVARAIHELSARRKQPLIPINCSAIPANLLESELFGHTKGAFTGATQNRPGRFQLAGSGTLFLDEISDMSLDLQAKLLRAIQNKSFDPIGASHSVTLEARIIAASNQDLDLAVTEKRFRQDLYYRLNVIPVLLPPLRSRKSDIPLLVKCFIDKFSQVNSKSIGGISEEALQCLMQYQWPGNIRELENFIERVIVLKRSEGIVELKDLPISHFKTVRLDKYIATHVSLPEDGLDFNDAVNDFENELILQALQKTAGNKNKAATLLNLNRTTLVEKLKRKGLVLAS